MEDFKLMGMILGNSAIWEVLRYFHQYRIQKKYKNAEINSINVQANDVVINNLLKWSEKMEKRINELEKKNKEMQVIICKQRERINDLEVYTEKLESKLKKQQEKYECE